jgi:hypothetical protein
MNNVLSTISKETGTGNIPYVIWHPTIARASTYRELARRKPEMKPQVLRASIVGNYQDLFNELLNDVTPDKALIQEASESSNLYYKAALERRASELDITPGLEIYQEWKRSTRRNVEYSHNTILKSMSTTRIRADFKLFYDGIDCDVSRVELLACLPEEWKLPADREVYTELDYIDWPES